MTAENLPPNRREVIKQGLRFAAGGAALGALANTTCLAPPKKQPVNHGGTPPAPDMTRRAASGAAVGAMGGALLAHVLGRNPTIEEIERRNDDAEGRRWQHWQVEQKQRKTPPSEREP